MSDYQRASGGPVKRQKRSYQESEDGHHPQPSTSEPIIIEETESEPPQTNGNTADRFTWVARNDTRRKNMFDGTSPMDCSAIEALVNKIMQEGEKLGATALHYTIQFRTPSTDNARSAIKLKHCAFCASSMHTLMKCPVPSVHYADTAGCPVCNVKSTDDGGHHFDNCPHIKDWKRNNPEVYKENMWSIVYLSRRNKPPIRSVNHTWMHWFEVYVKMNDIPLNLPVYGEMPWTKLFARRILSPRPGDPIFQDKIQPHRFDVKKHQYYDLPADPFWKGKMVRDVLEMINTKQFQSELFAPGKSDKV
ncbi:hypothetical protein OQA88_11262 [Cercophora sp. LCS_1]